MANERITDPSMTVDDVVLRLAGCNPGAITVCANILLHAQEIDPDAAMGGVLHLLRLDSMNIWEERIWGLYRDVCGRNLKKVIAVIRANQLGQLAGVTGDVLRQAIDSRNRDEDGNVMIDTDAVIAAVKERLPNFFVAVSDEEDELAEQVDPSDED